MLSGAQAGRERWPQRLLDGQYGGSRANPPLIARSRLSPLPPAPHNSASDQGRYPNISIPANHRRWAVPVPTRATAISIGGGPGSSTPGSCR